MENGTEHLYLLFFFLGCLNFVLGSPAVWLVQPPSRMAERSPNDQRLPETMCPTHKAKNDIVSPVPSGIPFKIVWKNSTQILPVMMKIELLSSAGLNNILAKLDISGDPTYEPSNETTFVNVLIPHQMPCQECVIRLTLELEDRSQIISCADVQVLEMAHSSILAQQLGMECVEDEDCGRGNDCFQGHCYCQSNYFGTHCSNASKSETEDLNRFTNVRFPMSGSELLWRVEKDSLEYGLRVNGRHILPTDDSVKWFVLGIQSTAESGQQADPMCLQMVSEKAISEKPHSDPKDNATSSSQRNPVAGGVPLHGGGSKNAVAGDIPPQFGGSSLNILKLEKNQKVCGPNEQFEKCPEVSRECEASCDWVAFPEQIPTCPSKSEEKCGEPRCVCLDGFVRLSAESDECKAFSFCQAPEVVQECPQNETWAKCGNVCEQTCETMLSPEPCNSICEHPGCKCADNFVRSPTGHCMHWITCPGSTDPATGNSQTTPADATTTDTNEELITTTESSESTFNTQTTSIGSPLQCKGNETFNECGRVCEADCRSIFEREECRDCTSPACACQQGFARNNGVCVYWGDCPGHDGTSNPPQPELSISHGRLEIENKKKSNDADYSCESEFRWPAGCRPGENCEYMASWEFNPDNEDVQFSVSSKGIGRWSGIGFSRNGLMANSDIYTGWVYDGKAYVSDRFAFSQNLPAIDPAGSQDIYNISGHVIDDMQTISFRRKIITNDKKTDFQLDDCYYFMFPIGGGRVLVKTNKDFHDYKTPIGYHDQNVPQISTLKTCICNDKGQPIGGRTPRRIKRASSPQPASLTPPSPAAEQNQGPGYACADVMIVEVKKDKVRVVDGFGLSAATLMPDENWGGRQSFTDVSIRKDQNGSLMILVKRPLDDKSNNRADLTIPTNKNIPVFLAHGNGALSLSGAKLIEFATIEMRPQEPTSTQRPKETTSTEPSTRAEPKEVTPELSTTARAFETEPPAKGSSSKEREETKTTVLFEKQSDFDENCMGGFAWPERCLKPNGDFSQCQYMVEWQILPNGDAVDFHLLSTYKMDTWTGIGFSTDGKMANADVIVISTLREGVSVTDQFSPGYGRPRLDTTQDVYNIASGTVEGQLYVNFSRSLTTDDSADDVDLMKCNYFLFVHSGGPLEAESKEVMKHSKTPIVSRNPICLGKCHLAKSVTTQGTTTSSSSTEDLTEADELTTIMTESVTTSTMKLTTSRIDSTTTTTTEGTTTERTAETEETVEEKTTEIPAPATTTKTITTKTETTKRRPEIITTSTTTRRTTTTSELPETPVSDNDVIRLAGVAERTTTTTTVKPTKPTVVEMVFDMALKLVDEKWNDDLGNSSTSQFKKLSNKLKNYLFPVISSKWKSLKELTVIQFAKGSVLALIQGHFSGEAVPSSAEELKEFLQEVAGKAGDVHLDAEMLQVRDKQIDYEDRWAPLRDIQIWAIVCLALIGILAVTALLVLFTFRRRNRRTYPNQTPIIGTPNPYQLYGGYAYGAKNGVSSSSEMGADQKNSTIMPMEKKSNGKKNGISDKDQSSSSPAASTECPGIGEATYREWFSKVASKDSVSHFQENNYQSTGTASGTLSRPATTAHANPAYITYPPNDQSAYYTMGGEHRIPPPPAYYRQY